MEIVRKNLITSSIDAALMLKPGLGYIRISRFAATTYKDFMEKMEELYEKKGMRNLVIDLRQNPGGYLEETSKILSQLIPQKDVVFLKTQGEALGKREYKSIGMTFFQIEKILGLVRLRAPDARVTGECFSHCAMPLVLVRAKLFKQYFQATVHTSKQCHD